MNIEEREALSTLILAITKSGDYSLDPAQVKQVKAICKKSDTNVKTAYELLMIQLKRKHAQIRYSSTQLIAELFQRSHVFRELLVADYSIFLQLTVGIHQNTLPPPVAFAEKTKQLAISLTNEWNGKYGAVYKQIALGYDFLRYHLKVDFTNLVPVTEEARNAEKMAQEEMTRRLRQKRYEKAAFEVDELADAIQENIRNMNSCFEILVPKLDDEAALNAIFSKPVEDTEEQLDADRQDASAEDEETEEDSTTIDETMLRYDPLGVHDNALGSTRYKLTINVSKDNPVDVMESELFATLRESYRLIVKKHWPMVTEWLDVLMKADHGAGEQRTEYDRLLKLVIDLKRGVADAKIKSEDLGINMETMYGPDEHDSDEDDEEFEEVDVLAPKRDKKKGKEVRNIQKMEKKSRNPVFAMQGEKIMEDDPTYAGGAALLHDRRTTGSESDSKGSPSMHTAASPVSTGGGEETRDELLARAPVVPWDDDLALWGKKEMAFNTSGLEYSHRFLGVADGSNMVSQATLDRMKMRTRFYDPQLPEVIKACRYPMNNGRLCMRRDLVRCPYHGPIVPRDEHGQIERQAEEGGFIPEEDALDDDQEADLINRAIAAAAGPSKASSKPGASSSVATTVKDTTTWEDIEDD
ncbi:hypothetical protein BGX34_007499, partial [Mortierella sp. NVP85]